MAENVTRVPKRILVSLMESLSAGVVPRSGAPYVAIGRADEVSALLDKIKDAGEGGAFTRFIIGKYGSGKSFLIQLVRGYAVEKGFVCCDCDLTPERRLSGSGGNGLATYRELIRNMSTKTSGDGGALSNVLLRWISRLQAETASDGIAPDSPDFEKRVSERIFKTTGEIETSFGGFDFAYVLNTFYRAHVSGDDLKKTCALKWLSGLYETKSEAKRDLGVGSVINDDTWYDYIKLMARFVRGIGYEGLIVFVDECVNLYKIVNRQARESNYEKLLSMFNDTLQGGASYLGLVFGGTPAFLEDSRRGLYSYEALRSRLTDARFASGGYRNLRGPVIRLERLTDDELYALVKRVYELYKMNYSVDPGITDEDLALFLEDTLSGPDAGSMITPREVIRDLLSLLDVLGQNEGAAFGDLVKAKKKEKEENAAGKGVEFLDF